MKKILLISLIFTIQINGINKTDLVKELLKSTNINAIDIGAISRSWSKTNDTLETHVTMFSGAGQISYTAKDSSPKTIWTNGLSGCIALALFTKCVSGDRHVALLHHPPIWREHQIKALKRHQARMEYACGGASKIEKIELIAMLYPDWIKPENSEHWVEIISKEDLAHTQRIAQITGVNPKILLYSGMGTDNGDEFQVTLAPDRTTYSSTVDGHELHEIK